jgi:thiamine-monophosphate kinase
MATSASRLASERMFRGGKARYNLVLCALAFRHPRGTVDAMELEFVQWLRRCFAGSDQPKSARVVLGMGDDASLIEFGRDEQCVVTTDMLMDGTHFRLDEYGPRRVGRKALAVNLSDVAAMAAEPVAAFVSLALPDGDAAGLAREVFSGLAPLADEFGVVIAGGDTNCWRGPLVISITVIGWCPTSRALRRSGAQPGDAILVTGELGGSILGKHLDFTPRIREALTLAASLPLHAGCDLSDGLALDLWRVTQESGCGAVLDAASIPISPAAHELSRQPPVEMSPLDRALSDGEDFELLLACPDSAADALLAASPLTTRLTKIGYFVGTPGLFLRDSDGSLEELVPRGYRHGQAHDST